MKKFRNTRHGYIGKSQYLTLDTLEQQVKEQQARLDEMIAKLKKEITNS